MAKLRGYACSCGHQFEYTHMGPDDAIAVCPECALVMVADNEVLGGRTFHVIVPMSNTSVRHKAGSVHRFVNKPAEKVSVSVPKKVE